MLSRSPSKNHALRIYSVAVALIAGGAVAYSVDASANASRATGGQATMQADLQRVTSLMDATVARDRSLVAENRRLVRRYNALVASTRAALHAADARRAAAAAARLAAQAVAAAATPAPALPVVVAAPAAAPAPATQTS